MKILGINDDGQPQYTSPEEIAASAPAIITDSITTSRAQVNTCEDLADVLRTKKYVTIDNVIPLTDQIYSTVANQEIIGTPTGALIINGAAMANKTGLMVSGNNSLVRGLFMDNPGMIVDRTRGTTRQAGLGIAAHNVTLTDSTFYRMLHSAYVLSSGEWTGTVIDRCRALECIGSGGGPTDIEDDWGEDKGDAFTTWGASGRITNCLAQAMAGQDCRIAFHAEGLPGSHSKKNPLIDEADFIFANNIAMGSFRRHYVFEDVRRGIMNSNISDGGATWWHLALIQTNDVIVDNMLINVTRQSTDLSGEYWAPSRAVICLMNFSNKTKISNIKAVWDEGASMAAFFSKDDGKDPAKLGHVNSLIQNSEFHMSATNKRRGIDITGLNAPTIDNVAIENCQEPVFGFGSKGIAKIKRLDVKNFTKGLHTESNFSGGVMIDGANFDNSALPATDTAPTSAIRHVNSGFLNIKNTNVQGVENITHVSGGKYLTHLTVAQNQSIGRAARILVDYKASGTVPVVPNIVNNIDVTGEFTQTPPAV